MKGKARRWGWGVWRLVWRDSSGRVWCGLGGSSARFGNMSGRAQSVAGALVPAVSRLVSTLGRCCDTVPKPDVGMSADAAGTSARATARHSGLAARVAVCALFVSLLPLAAAPQMSFEEAQALIEAGKYVKVLDYALDTVRRNPESFEGQYLLGLTVHRGEGNLPLAQYRLEQAKRIVRERGGFRALPDDRQEAYLERLPGIVWVYGASEQTQMQLDLVPAT